MVERTEEMKKITTDFYDNFAEKYWAKHAKYPVESLKKFIGLLPGRSILDLGGGGGRDALFLGAAGFNPICADLSPVMCRKAKERKLPAVVMDQEKLAFRLGVFDGIWARSSLLHSPPEVLPGILADLRLILKPRGVLFLGMKASIGQYVETEFKTTENGSTYYCYWPTYRLHGLLETCGFEVWELSILGKDSFNERNYFETYAVKE